MPLIRAARLHPLAISAVLLALPASAQDRPGDIVVLGSTKHRRDVAEGLSRRISIMTDGQISRFGSPVCVSILGLPEDYAEAVRSEVYASARNGGMATGPAACRPNVTVMIAKDAVDLVRRLPDLPSRARARELSQPRPTYLFDSVEVRSRDGDRLGRLARPIAPGSDPDLPILQVRDASRVTRSTRRDLNCVLLIVERSAALGKTIRQLGAYVTMRTLAHASDRHVSPTDPTILGLFKAKGGQAAPGLTEFDRGFLTAIYRGDAARDGTVHGSEIVRLAGPESDGEPSAIEK